MHDLPPIPPILQVQHGTNLSFGEIDFLTQQGLDFIGRLDIAGVCPQGPALKIDINSYPQRINIDDPTNRL